MKKIISCILSLAFVFSIGATAMATEDFSQWGNEWEWTQEQIEISTGWTDKEWDAYYEAQDVKREIERKKEYGLPHLEGINVKVNDKYITFKDAIPTEKNDRVMVPALPIFEALGAAVTYDEPSDSVTIVKGTTTISFKIGDTKLSIMDNGVDREETMDVPAYVDDTTDRTYVPTRAVAQSLGCDVHWDENFQVVFIIDKNGLIEELDKNFTIYNSFMQNSAVDLSKTYKSAFETNLSGTLYGDTKDDVVSINGKFNMLSQGLNFNLSGTIKTDVNDIKDSLLSSLGEEELATLKKFETISLDMISNVEEGKFYVKSNGMEFLAGTPKDTWMEGENLMGEAGYLLEDYEEMTLGKLLYEMCWQQKAMYSYEPTDIYKNANDMAAVYNIMLGDDGFQKSTSGSVNTYTTKMNKLTLIARVAKYVKAENIDIAAMLEDNKIFTDINYELVLKEQNNKVLSISMNGDITIGGMVPTKISFKVAGDTKQSTGEIGVTGRYFGKIVLDMKTTQAESTEKLMTKPKETEKVMLWSEVNKIQSQKYLEEQAKREAQLEKDVQQN